MSDTLNYLFLGICPTPTYRNVIPDGEGWYRFDGTYWIKSRMSIMVVRQKYITEEDLMKFAKDALKVIAGKDDNS